MNILVPIDFSENSLDAARYVMNWSAQLPIDKIVLYHSAFPEPGTEEAPIQALETVRDHLVGEREMAVECVVNHATLVEGIGPLIAEHHISLVVMGITGRNKVGQRLIGSHVFQISQNVDVPVLIVPAKTVYQPVENVALALPFMEDLKTYVPHEDIKSLVRKLDANLMVVNVGKARNETPVPILYSGMAAMFDMFDELNPTYHFLTEDKTADGIANFAENNHAQLLISISGKYGFLQGMFRSSVTRQIAYQSVVPLLIYRAGRSK